MSLTIEDVSGPNPVDRPTGHLGSVPELLALHEPAPLLDLVPRHILQQSLPDPRPVRIRRGTRTALATIAIHLGFAAAFIAVLTWRSAPSQGEVATPVDVVVEAPPPKPQVAPKPEPLKPEPPKSLAQMIPQAQPAPAPDPHPPAPPAVQPPQPEAPSPPPLLAPPPEPTRARTQTQENKPANLEPDTADAPQATHESKPLEAPKVLSTTDATAGFAVPKPDDPRPQPPTPAPAPDAPKARSETEKLAAALPNDMTALPDSFRAVLSGNGAAIDAAYKGLVYGPLQRHAQDIGERARQQHLKGQVIVAFTIGDDGGIKSLAVLQSSGNPAVDALGLEAIRAAAPFPAPPAGAPRSFTPALAFGN